MYAQMSAPHRTVCVELHGMRLPSWTFRAVLYCRCTSFSKTNLHRNDRLLDGKIFNQDRTVSQRVLLLHAQHLFTIILNSVKYFPLESKLDFRDVQYSAYYLYSTS